MPRNKPFPDSHSFGPFERRNKRVPPRWEETHDDGEDGNEFIRRQQGEIRETVKRQRAAQKLVRLEREEELTERAYTDRRASEKDRKRLYNDLKRLAEALGIKQTLQHLNRTTCQTCWGPDIISDKERPSLGIVLNYAGRLEPAGEAPAVENRIARLFGAWLYFSGNRVVIAVASKQPGENDTQIDHAAPPARDTAVLVIPYDPAHHDHVRQQVTQALLNNGPVS